MSALQTLAAVCTEIDISRKRLCGVYFLILADEVVYVGQSLDVESRVNQHARGDARLAAKGFDRALWLPVAEGDLDAYEGALIRALRPRLSLRCPFDSQRDAEILSVLGLDCTAAAEASQPLPDPEVPPALGAKVRQVRKERGMSMREFGRLVGVGAPTVHAWENGGHGMTIGRLVMVAGILGIDVKELLA